MSEKFIRVVKHTGRSHLLILTAMAVISILALGCSSSGNRKNTKMNTDFRKGTYGYDAAFFAKNNVEAIELKDSLSRASVLIVPAYQGRVMTSSVNGNEGTSFGWINYRHIESGKISSQFNPFGGEERIWFGPEGGPFSIYFKQGDEQVFSNWKVPAVIDTEPFEVISRSSSEVSFRKEFDLVNASGNLFSATVVRTVKLLDEKQIEESLGISTDPSLSLVAYESENILENLGSAEWTEKTGTLSIWMLSMFNPSPDAVVFIPFKSGSADELGQAVNDDYFGKVPPERLIIRDNILFFRVDGRHRSKIGISPERALPFCGSYDPAANTLTLLWYSAPAAPSLYLNSKWGEQDFPFKGDAVNSYNDGPVEDGSVMGPFYEIESSSPAAFLGPGESMTHVQRIYHLSGEPEKLSLVTGKLFNISIEEIITIFNNQK